MSPIFDEEPIIANELHSLAFLYGNVLGHFLATCRSLGGQSKYTDSSEAKDIHSGRCDAFTWFELPENPRCPLADVCEAYKRRKPPPGAPAPDPAEQTGANGANVS